VLKTFVFFSSILNCLLAFCHHGKVYYYMVHLVSLWMRDGLYKAKGRLELLLEEQCSIKGLKIFLVTPWMRAKMIWLDFFIRFLSRHHRGTYELVFAVWKHLIWLEFFIRFFSRHHRGTSTSLFLQHENIWFD